MPPKASTRTSKAATSPRVAPAAAKAAPSRLREKASNTRLNSSYNSGRRETKKTSNTEPQKDLPNKLSSRIRGQPRRSARIAASKQPREEEPEQQASPEAKQSHSGTLRGPTPPTRPNPPSEAPSSAKLPNERIGTDQDVTEQTAPSQKSLPETADRGVQTLSFDPIAHRYRASTPEAAVLDQAALLNVRPWLGELEQSEPIAIPKTGLSYDDMPPKDLNAPHRPASGLMTVYSADDSNQRSKITDEKNTKYISMSDLRAQLEVRAIELKQSKARDLVADELGKAIATDAGTPQVEFENVIAHLEDFLNKNKQGASSLSGQQRNQLLENLRHSLNERLPACNSFSLTEADIQIDIDKLRADSSNEFILQRTVLFASIDRWRLANSIFTYDCERVWLPSSAHSLPVDTSRPGKALAPIQKPKPDLSLYFKKESIMKRWPKVSQRCVPDDLQTCVWPDDMDEQCFPFLFVEAKREDASLAKAHLRSLYATSQALYNMLQCMKKVQGVGNDADVKGLDELRTFSICINAQRCVVRAHQVSFSEMRIMEFTHRVVLDGLYDGHAVSKIIRTILGGYASETLYPILRRLYQRLTRPLLVERYGSDGLKDFLHNEKANPTEKSLAYDSKQIVSPTASFMEDGRDLPTAPQVTRRRPSEEDQGQSAAKKNKVQHNSTAETPTESRTITSSGTSGHLNALHIGDKE